MGSIGAGAVGTSIYPGNGPMAIHYILDQSQVTLAVVENEDHVRKIMSVCRAYPIVHTHTHTHTHTRARVISNMHTNSIHI